MCITFCLHRNAHIQAIIAWKYVVPNYDEAENLASFFHLGENLQAKIRKKLFFIVVFKNGLIITTISRFIHTTLWLMLVIYFVIVYFNVDKHDKQCKGISRMSYFYVRRVSLYKVIQILKIFQTYTLYIIMYCKNNKDTIFWHKLSWRNVFYKIIFKLLLSK